MRTLTLGCLAVVALAACTAPTWRKVGGTSQDFTQADYACSRDAAMMPATVTPPAVLPNNTATANTAWIGAANGFQGLSDQLFTAAGKHSLYMKCMRAAGWQQSDSSAPYGSPRAAAPAPTGRPQ